MDNNKLEKSHHDKVTELITCGHIPSAVWFVAWPTVVNTIFQTAYNLINRVFLGGLSASAVAQAAIGFGTLALMIQFAIMVGISAGTSALVSRFLGAKETADAEEATRQSLILAVVGGLVSMLPLMLLARPFVVMIGAKGGVIGSAAAYMAILGAFSIPMHITVIASSALRAAGDSKSPLYTGIVMVLLNILFDYLLIFGTPSVRLFGIELIHIHAMGIRGAAYATGISRVVGMLIFLVFLHRSVLGGALRHFKVHWGWFGRIFNIGWPAAIQQLLFATGTTAYFAIIGHLPNSTAIAAALTVAVSIESISFMPGIAYMTAATPLVGQNLGAGKPKRAEHCAWVATSHAAAIMTFVALIFLIFPEPLAGIFTKDPAVIAPIVSYLRINALCQPLLAVGMVLAGALQGAGDTRFPTWVEFIVNYVVRLSLAWILAKCLGMNAVGAWIAMSVSNMLYGVLMTFWFRRGNWKTVQV